ncbi:MAG: NAD(P)-dependent oxidoreductase, partial [Pseudomonadota bacterium]
LGPVRMNPGPDPFSAAELARECAEAEALMAFMTERVDAALLDACPRLRVVAGAFKGFDNVDREALRARGIAFSYVPDLLTWPTAELAVGLAIALARNMRPGDAAVRGGGFQGWRPTLYGASLLGACVGVVGAGAVGQAILQLLSGFPGERLAAEPDAEARAQAQALGAETTSLADLAARADVVMLATPLTPRTLGLVDAAFLAAMRPGALLVNPARGSVVQEAAVADALASGRLGGYAADVFELEDRSRPDAPSDVHPALLAHPRTVFTPHLGSAVVETRRAIARAAADEILARLAAA